jgi:GTP-binding protein
LPEVAFWGRSNVGKSSLLNALTGRRDLARVSRTPGRTRAILFFALGERLVLVDLPGYGHARASRAEARAWSEFVERYLSERARLVRVCLLIDARRGVQPVDRSMIALLDAAAQSYEAVLTKADALAPAALEAVRGATAAELVRHAAAHPEIAVTSARTGRGIPELRQSLAALAAPHSFR